MQMWCSGALATHARIQRILEMNAPHYAMDMKYARVHRRPHANPKFFSLGNSCAAHMRNVSCCRPRPGTIKNEKYGNNFIHLANGAAGMCGIIFNWPGVNYAVNAAQQLANAVADGALFSLRLIVVELNLFLFS